MHHFHKKKTEEGLDFIITLTLARTNAADFLYYPYLYMRISNRSRGLIPLKADSTSFS